MSPAAYDSIYKKRIIYGILWGQLFFIGVIYKLFNYFGRHLPYVFAIGITNEFTLTKAEEKLLLDTYAGTELQIMFAIALYTGMRPNEYETAKLDGKFIVAKNSKRKNGKVEYKKIPITPMLEPYLNGVTEISFSSLRIIRDRFNKLFPNHKLYDLRTTFYTRCQECGVAEVARDLFVGHSLGALGNAYTDISDEYLLKEGQKLKY